MMPPRCPRSRALLAVVAALAFPGAAAAAGFDIPEDGALPLGLGGTTTLQLGTAYALEFNPAGLARVDGLDIRFDTRLTAHAIAFQRAETETTRWDPVANSAGAFPAPRLTAAWRVPGLRNRVTLGLGAWGPPGVGRYRWPDPLPLMKEGQSYADIDTVTAQRYSLVGSDIILAFAAAGAGVRLTDTLSVGASFLGAWADVAFTQSVYVPLMQDDAFVRLAATDAFTPTFNAGIAWSPVPSVTLAASYRLGYKVGAAGTLEVVLPEYLEGTASVEGDKATLQQNMPAQARLGASWTGGRLQLALEGVYDGWSAVDKLVITPDVKLKMGPNATAIEPIVVEKHWKDSFAVRCGAVVRLLDEQAGRPGVSLLAGGLFETNAIPAEYQAVDFVTGDRLGASAGVLLGMKGFELAVSGMYFPETSVTVTGSKAARTSAMPEKEPVYANNGRYTSSAWSIGLGLGWRGRVGSL